MSFQRIAARGTNGLAFKVNYNDGGAGAGLIGYKGTCSKHIMHYNVNVSKRPWCSNDQNKCRQYCDKGQEGRRPKGPCYESELLLEKPFKFYTGTFREGDRQYKPIPIDFNRVSEGDIVLLTTRAPKCTEQERIVFACYRVGRVDSDETGIFIESDGSMDLVVPEGTTMYYWSYQKPNKDGACKWDSGLFRYLDGQRTTNFINDLVSRLGKTPERDMVICTLGSAIEIKPPQRRSGGPGGHGEGDEHQQLKNRVAECPELIGLPGRSKATVEYSFPSGDRVDVKFEVPNGGAAVVEVETIAPLPGVYQAIKYRALLEVERLEALGSGRVKAILVAHRFDAETRKLARKYQIKLVKLRA